MARIRTVKPSFFTSPSTAAVDFPVRIFYEALWCWADDFGIGETNLNGLLGFAFPDSDGFTAQDVRRFCADCARHFDVYFYTVRGRHFYAITTWDEHQKLERRNERRKNPMPDDPDAIPDQRIYDCADFAPILRRKGSAESVLEVRKGKGKGEGSDAAEPPQCHRHPVNSTKPCGACRARRDWEQKQADLKAADELDNRRRERERSEQCPDCQGTNFIDIGPNQVAKCSHPKVMAAANV